MYEILRMLKFIETESRIMAARRQEEGKVVREC